jgi:hypothetical protein
LTTIARLLLVLVVYQSPAFAIEEIKLELDSIETEFFSSDKFELTITTEQSDRSELLLQLGNIRSPFLDSHFDASLRCPESSYTTEIISCDNGMLEIVSPKLGLTTIGLTFQLNIPGSSSRATLAANTEWGKLDAKYQGLNNNWQVDVVTQDFQLNLLSALLESSLAIFNGHSITDGKLNLQARIKGSEDGIENVSLQANATELGVEGDSVLHGVSLKTQLEMKMLDNKWSFTHTLNLLSGEMYIQPGLAILGEEPGFYIEIPAEQLVFRLAGNWFPAGNIVELQDLYYLHPDILQLQSSVRLSISEQISYSDLTMHAKVQDLAGSYSAYIQPILMQTNFSDLELSGSIDLSLDYQGSELDKIELFVDDVFLEDTESRFGLYGLNSHLVLDSKPEAVQSTLTWDGMSFYRLDFGPGNIIFESAGKDVRVLEWQDVSILDGGLKIEEFALRNLASSEFELELGGMLTPISMEALTQALGWTIFPGKLSGKISGLKYVKNNIHLEGDIVFKLFGGQLNIQALQVVDLFSSYSVLTTDIKIEQLDLEQLTDVFTFGKIEGSLNGRMDKLRLENWQPSYFEMEFATPEDDDKPHRISQKALENLNELGGGLSGTLSQGFLRFLPAYSYGRLGVGCRLYQGICELSGVEDDGDSFSILTKGGMFPPWVEVKGAGRSIKWDDLIDGLKQIAEGEVEIE